MEPAFLLNIFILGSNKMNRKIYTKKIYTKKKRTIPKIQKSDIIIVCKF